MAFGALPLEHSAPSDDTPDVLPNWAYATVEDRQRDDVERLAEDLEFISMRDLRAIANRHGWPVRGARKREVVAQLVAHLIDPDHARQAYDALDAEDRRVLWAIMVLEDEPGSEAAILSLAQSFGPLTRHSTLAPYLDRLVQSGLVLPRASVYYVGPSHDLVPRAVLRALPPALEEVLPDALRHDPQIFTGETRPADPGELLRACGHILMLLEETPAAPRPPRQHPSMVDPFGHLRGWDYLEEEVRAAQERNHFTQPHTFSLTVPTPGWALSDADVARLAPVAGGEARLDLIYGLLVGAGLLRAGDRITVNQEAKAHYLMRDPAAQRAALARAYFATDAWSEAWEVLRRNRTLRLRRYLQPYRTFTLRQLGRDLADLRRLVLRALSAVPDGRWVRMDDLLALFRSAWSAFDPLPLHPVDGPRHTPWNLRAARGDGSYGPPAWEDAQGAFIEIMLVEPLRLLGLVDLAERRGRVEAVRFHGLADLFFDRVEVAALPAHARPAEAISPEEALRVEGRDEGAGAVRITVAASALSGEAHGLLGRIARLERAAMDGFDYVLDAETTYATFEAGEALEDVMAAWERLLPIAMPPPVRRRLEEWWQAYGRVRVYQDVAVIEFADDYALAEMRAVSSLDEVLVAELSPRAVVVLRDQVARLVAELEKAGYTPKRTGAV